MLLSSHKKGEGISPQSNSPASHATTFCEVVTMATIAQPTIQAKYASVYDASARIAKVNQGLYVFYDDGRVEDFSIEMAPFTVVLGDVAVSELQAMLDRVAGGPVGVCLAREQEVK
jgi:hypothetical protein